MSSDRKRRFSSAYDNSLPEDKDSNYVHEMRKAYNEEIRRLNVDVIKLRKDVDKKNDELIAKENENKDMITNFNIIITNLDAEKNNLTEEVAKYRNECQTKEDNIKGFLKKSNEYKEYLKNKNKETENQLESERNKSKHLESRNNILIKEKEQLINALSEEKKKSRLSGTVGSKQAINQLHQKCNDLQTRLDIQIKVYNKQTEDHKNEIIKLKKNHNLEVVGLKKQRQYFQKNNELNKRKLLSAQYEGISKEKIYRKNIPKLYKSTQSNTKKVLLDLKSKVNELIDKSSGDLYEKNRDSAADVVRENIKEIQVIELGANELQKKQVNDKFPCPFPSCDRTLANSADWRQHMTKKHLFNFDTYSKVNQSEKQVLEIIDLTD